LLTPNQKREIVSLDVITVSDRLVEKPAAIVPALTTQVVEPLISVLTSLQLATYLTDIGLL
jgi:hypothetical protein